MKFGPTENVILDESFRTKSPHIRNWLSIPGVREILESFFGGKSIRNEYLIVDKGKLAGTGAHSYSAGDATKGSEEGARYERAWI